MKRLEKQYNCYQLAKLGRFYLGVAKKYVEDAEKEILDRGNRDMLLKKFNEFCEMAIRHCASAISYTLRNKDPELLPVRAECFYCVSDAYTERTKYHDAILNSKSKSLTYLSEQEHISRFTKNEKFISKHRKNLADRVTDVEAESKRKKTCHEKADRADKMAKAAEKEYAEYLEMKEEKRVMMEQAARENAMKEPIVQRIALGNNKENGVVQKYSNGKLSAF